jgi:hypothetical protein
VAADVAIVTRVSGRFLDGVMCEQTSGPDSHWAEQRSLHGGVDEIPLPGDVPGRASGCAGSDSSVRIPKGRSPR